MVILQVTSPVRVRWDLWSIGLVSERAWRFCTRKGTEERFFDRNNGGDEGVGEEVGKKIVSN